MEAAAAFGHGNGVKKEDKRAESDGGDDESFCKRDVFVQIGKYGNQENQNEEKTSSSDQKDLSCSKLQDEELECARTEMGEVREENQRLKMSLSRIMKDYEALRTQFLGIVGKKSNREENAICEEIEEPDNLVSLTLGRFPSEKKKENSHKEKFNQTSDEIPDSGRLSLALDCKFDAPAPATAKTESPLRSRTDSFDREAKEEDAGETWPPPAKGVKVMRSGDDEVSQQNPPKKARVCVRARCETATMSDGCQWRKYGQKIAKGNPCPRAYYRCTGSPACPVRKQVQRCADDMSILITTYEGTHNHPLPVSATAMASTTSAAASMLLSGSSSSTSATTSVMNPSSSSLNFHLSANPNSKPFLVPNSSFTSTSPTHPTITLDLTSNSPSSSSSCKFPSSFPTPGFPFASQLDFGSARTNILPWNNGVFSYGNHRITPNNNVHQNYTNKNNNNNVGSLTGQPVLPETISAATKAITSDPSFQSALAAALSTIIGGGSDKLKPRGDQLFQLSSYGHQTTK